MERERQRTAEVTDPPKVIYYTVIAENCGRSRPHREPSVCVKPNGPAKNGETSNAYLEHGLPPPRRVKQRRDQKVAKKQVHTMAKAEKAASGSDWHIPLWTADGEVWLQGKSRMYIV